MSHEMTRKQHAEFKALGVEVKRHPRQRGNTKDDDRYSASFNGRYFDSYYPNKVKLAVLAAAKEST